MSAQAAAAAWENRSCIVWQLPGSQCNTEHTDRCLTDGCVCINDMQRRDWLAPVVVHTRTVPPRHIDELDSIAFP